MQDGAGAFVVWRTADGLYLQLDAPHGPTDARLTAFILRDNSTQRTATVLSHSILPRIRDRAYLRRDPIAFARSIGVQVGRDCRLLGISRSTFGSEPYLITIGDHVTITGGVRIITHDGGVWVLRGMHPQIDVFGPVSIGNNVFIGYGVTILPGVTVGENTVIGAGTLVTRDVPSEVVFAGVPGKVLSTLKAYEKKSIQASMETKGLSAEKKREALLAHFRHTSRDIK